MTLQAALKNSSRRVATRPPFSSWGRASLWRGTQSGAAHRDPRYDPYVLATLQEGGEGAFSEVLFEHSLFAFSSSLGAEPGLLFGVSDTPLVAFWTYLLTEERLMEKVRAAWALDIPPLTA